MENYKSPSKQRKAELSLRRRVAKKFEIHPISLRATKLLNTHCKSRDQVLEWLKSKHILKIRQMGKKTLRELYCAFECCKEEAPCGHDESCDLAVKSYVNYRAELASYAQIFRKRLAPNVVAIRLFP